MAGLHAIQLHGQIMNFDVKSDNILFYNVEPGGYWHYIIHGQDFYVPNFGKLFVINDFGISRPMSPTFPLYKSEQDTTFRLGSRYAIVKNNKFVPLNSMLTVSRTGEVKQAPFIKWGAMRVSKGGQYSMERETSEIIDVDTELHSKTKKFLRKKNIPTDSTNPEFFLYPEVIPPFEFYNDTQDAIRTFIGGKRSTQRGNHHKFKVPSKLVTQMTPYKGKGDSMSDSVFKKTCNIQNFLNKLKIYV
jgi:hypothetical protein